MGIRHMTFEEMIDHISTLIADPLDRQEFNRRIDEQQAELERLEKFEESAAEFDDLREKLNDLYEELDDMHSDAITLQDRLSDRLTELEEINNELEAVDDGE